MYEFYVYMNTHHMEYITHIGKCQEKGLTAKSCRRIFTGLFYPEASSLEGLAFSL